MRDANFPDTYGRFWPGLRTRCARVVGHAAAEDVVQETFLRWWLVGPEPDAPLAATGAWLRRTAARLSIDVLRSRARDEASVHARRALAPACSETPHDQAMTRASLLALRTTVPRQELQAALLVRVDGMSHPDAAAALDVSERTVRRLLDRFDARTAPLRDTANDGAPTGSEDNGSALLRIPVFAAGILLLLAALFAGRSCAASETPPSRGDEAAP